MTGIDMAGIQNTPGIQADTQGGATQLFTQAQVSAIVSQRVNGLNQRIADLQAQLTASTNAAKEAQARLTVYSQKETASKLGIPDAFTDFAIYSAGQLVTPEKPFDTALSEWWSTNKVVLGIPSTAAQAGQAGVIPTQPNATATQAGVAQQTAGNQPTVAQQVGGTGVAVQQLGVQAAPAQGAGVVQGTNPAVVAQQGAGQPMAQAQPVGQAQPMVQAQQGAVVQQFVGSTGVAHGGTGLGVAGTSNEVNDFIKNRYGRK